MSCQNRMKRNPELSSGPGAQVQPWTIWILFPGRCRLVGKRGPWQDTQARLGISEDTMEAGAQRAALERNTEIALRRSPSRPGETGLSLVVTQNGQQLLWFNERIVKPGVGERVCPPQQDQHLQLQVSPNDRISDRGVDEVLWVETARRSAGQDHQAGEQERGAGRCTRDDCMETKVIVGASWARIWKALLSKAFGLPPKAIIEFWVNEQYNKICVLEKSV